MDFEKLNGKSIAEAFTEFDKENPAVWALYIRYAEAWIRSQITANDWKNADKVRISSKQVIGRIRWYSTVETTGKDYKINDAFTPYYARKFVKEFEHYKKVFEMRERAKKPRQLKMDFKNKKQGRIE